MRTRSAVLVAVLGVAVVVASVVFDNATKFADDGAYGRVSLLPGQRTLSLPARQVDITFTEDLVNRVVDIPEFGLTVCPAPDGPSVAAHFHDGGAQGVNGVTRAPVGTVSLPRAGRYVVRVSGTPVGLGQEVRFGRLHAHHWTSPSASPSAPLSSCWVSWAGWSLATSGAAGPGSNPDRGSTRRYRRAAWAATTSRGDAPSRAS